MEIILDPNETVDLNRIDICHMKIQTRYCVEDSVHKEQVMASLARKLPSIPVAMETTYDPIAVVCSGPSLKKTWEEIRKFSKIMTCSGSHDFLLERGMMPTYHMETDPRPHKSLFVKNPQPTVKYFIASCCHASVFEALEGMQVFIWHVLSSKESDEMYRDGDWILTGGSNVGLRALVMARLMGHTNVHVFGMDCSAEDNEFRAHEHPNPVKDKAKRFVKVGDKEFVTTEVYLEYARQFFWETILLSDTQFTLHGDGLLQHLALLKINDPEHVKRRMAEMQARQGKSTSIAFCKGTKQ